MNPCLLSKKKLRCRVQYMHPLVQLYEYPLLLLVIGDAVFAIPMVTSVLPESSTRIYLHSPL